MKPELACTALSRNTLLKKTIDLPEGNYLPGAARLWGELEYCNCRSVSEHRIDIRGAYTLNRCYWHGVAGRVYHQPDRLRRVQ